VIGIFFPSVVSYVSKTFYDEDVRRIVEARHKQAWDQLTEYEEHVRRERDTIKVIESELAWLPVDPQAADRVRALLELKRQYQSDLSAAKPPILINSFYLNEIWPLFAFLLTSLGWLAFILRPVGTRVFERPWATLAIFGPLFVFHRWPTWLRNTRLGLSNRVYYSNSNFDISVADFFAQEIITAIVLLLLAVIWRQWLSHYSQWRAELTGRPDDPVAELLDPNYTTLLARCFVRWQICSVVLCLGFCYYSYFFWRLVGVNKDIRYWPATIIIHLLWFTTWILISLPLATTWYRWHLKKLSAIAIVGRDRPANSEIITGAIAQLDPLPSWNLFGSAVAIIASIGIPILQLFK